jgi:pyruvate/2-oxoglutarate dehydrogenase complex dihydrolipoamide acyltransferase (E2) component
VTTPLRPLALPALFAAVLGVTGCSTPSPSSPSEGTAHATSAVDSAPVAASIAAPPASAPAPIASPAISASAPAPSAEPTASAVASASAAPAVDPSAPLPKVKVSNIGMHIGGGPNDAVTKEPIKRSVEPHMDEFRRCYALVADQKKTGDFGVDLRIDKAGGKAQVSHPRTALKGKEFEECVVGVFKGIDFLKPKKGNTVVSYSLRFTP